MGTRDPNGHEFGYKTKSVMSHGFLIDRFYFRGHGFGIAKPSGSIRVAISSTDDECLQPERA